MTGRNGDIRRQSGQGAGLEDVKHELLRLVPVAVPTGLRSRVLDGAGRARSHALLAPWMRFAAVACSVLIGALLALDPVVTRREESRLAAVLDGHSLAWAAPVTESELVEVRLEQGTGAERRARIQNLAAVRARKGTDGDSLRAMERLKGWLEYEDISEDPD